VKIAYLSLGSNIGDRERLLQDALRLLHTPDLRVVRISPVYQTEPQDVKAQPWFLNLVVEAETELFPRQLLARVQQIEKQLGRKRLAAKGPRTIDIDILLYDGLVYADAAVTVPHPEMEKRRFVLVPLRDIAPDLVHPVSGRTIEELAAACSGQGGIKRTSYCLRW